MNQLLVFVGQTSPRNVRVLPLKSDGGGGYELMSPGDVTISNTDVHMATSKALDNEEDIPQQ